VAVWTAAASLRDAAFFLRLMRESTMKKRRREDLPPQSKEGPAPSCQTWPPIQVDGRDILAGSPTSNRAIMRLPQARNIE